ncbi:SubName: Full=Uncharacterized protein {ECO:0000313/EMBL:CCA74396.1} [Serendipita indica DSM 11827]|nr:SubName: Full=Uncharacterized protein {ECO:0000313/EMBL:CCA74396.1} [Serendipita indica DSM 11827]
MFKPIFPLIAALLLSAFLVNAAPIPIDGKLARRTPPLGKFKESDLRKQEVLFGDLGNGILKHEPVSNVYEEYYKRGIQVLTTIPTVLIVSHVSDTVF